MEFGKDLITNLRQRVLPGGDPALADRCDWHALSARLQAAHAARVELVRSEILDLRQLGGSFGSRSPFAQVRAQIGNCYALRNLNPSDSADGKALAGNAVAAVADRPRDGRG